MTDVVDQIKISQFPADISITKPIKEISIETVYNIIKSDEIKYIIEKIRSEKNEEVQKELKRKKLPFVTFGGVFLKREKKSLKKASGLICLDIDGLNSKDHAELLSQQIKDDKYSLLTFISPRGSGIKIIIRSNVSNDEEFKASFNALSQHYSKYIDISKFDPSNSDICRACFLSYDEHAYFNKEAETFTNWSLEVKKQISEKVKIKQSIKSLNIDKILSFINPDEYYSWIEVAMGLKSLSEENDVDLFDFFDNWSSNSEKYNGTESTRKKWDSFSTKEKGITFATVVSLAQKNGYITKEKEISELAKQAITFILSNQRSQCTELITNYIFSNNYIFSMRDDSHREIWIYKDGIYIPEGVSYINEICLDILGVAYTQHLCNDVVSKIEVRTYINYDDFFETKNPYLLAVQDGILNLKTFELEKFTPEKIFFNKINAFYTKNTQCPNIERFFSEILPSEDDVLVIQELFGFCLVKDYFIEKAFMFNGSGRNGKGKTLDLLTNFLGVENVCNISLENIRHDDFFMCNLQNRMANIGGDISDNKLKSTNAFKSVTGRDFITANRKGKSFVKFKNFSKMIFACNQIPSSQDNSDGFFMRWIVLNFPFKFVEEKYLKELSEEERKYCKKQDNHMIDKITTSSELNGLLHWSIEGLKRILKNGSFSYSKTSNEVRDIWLIKSDSFAVFVDKYITSGEFEDYIEYQDLKKEYNLFCKNNLIQPVSDKKIKNTLFDKFGVNPSRTTNLVGNKITVYKFVILKVK